jgi:hypothetical protein
MMYQSKLVASLKANGKILREFKDTVYIPFGSEYSFLLKNLHTQRAVVNIFIDGDDVVEGGVVLEPGREVDLERYIKNGNLTEGNRFKFIERTAAIEDGPRGVKLEDGLIRIEFQYEQPRPVIDRMKDQWNTKNIDSIYLQGGFYGATPTSYNVNGTLRSVDWSKNGEITAQAASASVDKYCADNGISNNMELHDGAATMDWNDVGITVPGSKSTQKFTHVTMGAMEAEKHSMVIKLLGETPDNKPVLKPVTVERKPKCVTCGKQNKAHAKYCVECGTALEIFA